MPLPHEETLLLSCSHVSYACACLRGQQGEHLSAAPLHRW